MKRPTPRLLEPATALKRIDAAKSNRPFMAALLDRSHSGHGDALAHWNRLHEAAFEKSNGPTSEPRHGSVGSDGDISFEPSATVGRPARHMTGRRADPWARDSGSVRRSTNIGQGSDSRRSRSLREQEKAPRRAGARGSGQTVYPDPERPLDIDPSVISPFLRWQDESEPDWLRRLAIAANGPRVSMERLAIIREAILREIGFYDLGSGPETDAGSMRESDWRVLAALQNVPVDGWESALSMGDEARAEFEQTGTLPMLQVLGPDGNIYQRLSLFGENPVGDALTMIDQRIRMMHLANPDIDVLSILPAVALARPSRQGGTPSRSPLATTVAPRVYQFLRSPRGAAATGLGIGAGLGVAGDAALEQRGGSDMDEAPDLPAAPGFEPPERPEDDESFDEASIEVETVPGLEIPVPDGPKVLIFPDVSDEIEQILIIERRERQETRDQIDALRDFYLRLHPDWDHHAGGRIAGTPTDRKEFRVEGPGAAFPHLVTGKPGDSRPGSIYVDLTFETPTGLVHVQTVDVDRDGLPTERELRTARRLADVTGRPVYIVPKTWQHR